GRGGRGRAARPSARGRGGRRAWRARRGGAPSVSALSRMIGRGRYCSWPVAVGPQATRSRQRAPHPMSSPASPNAAVEAPDSATQPVAEQDGRRPVRPRVKLGLALAGGGFRASLFHVGVLRRLAELDLLRRVEVLSTVSGGSIVGALYVLHLKAAMQARLIVAGEGPLCWSPVSADATP